MDISFTFENESRQAPLTNANKTDDLALPSFYCLLLLFIIKRNRIRCPYHWSSRYCVAKL